MTPRDTLKFQGETSLPLRYDMKVGIPFLMTQGNQHSSRVQKGENGLFLSWGMKLGVPLEWGRYLGDHPELHNGYRVPFGVSRRNVGFLSRHCSGKGPHLTLRGESHGFSRVGAGSLGFFLSCDGDLRYPLVLPPRNLVSFRVARGSSGFLSSGCRRKGPCLEVSQ